MPKKQKLETVSTRLTETTIAGLKSIARRNRIGHTTLCRHVLEAWTALELRRIRKETKNEN
jgi:hypothetical protein